MFTIAKPSVKTLIASIDVALANPDIEAQLEDDLLYSLDRLESAPEGSKILDVHKEKVPEPLKVQEGYWIINGTAHYLCVPRN